MSDDARQLIVLCDGTNNTFTGNQSDTNLPKLMRRLVRDERQLVFYDPGVGNANTLPAATPMDFVQRWFDRLYGLALGRGAYENIADGYRFLMRNWQPGDEIFVFGFSRGAFTARAIAGLVNQFGILRPEHENMVDTLVHVYFSDKQSRWSTRTRKQRIDSIAQEIRDLCTDPELLPQQRIWFVGVWDTVESIGIPPFTRQINRPATVKDKQMIHVRQALALDEHRAPFKPRLYIEDNFEDYGPQKQSLKQLWFPGSHCNVGGGYEKSQARLSDDALDWMVEEAQAKHLRVKPHAPTEIAPVVHAEEQAMPLWAVAGLMVRNPHQHHLKPVAHQAPTIRFPQDTMWVQQGLRGAAIALGFVIFLYLLMGAVLADAWPLQSPLSDWLRRVWAGNCAMLEWQLRPFSTTVPPGQWPATAIFIDFGFILSYGYVLGWLVAPAFATFAGLRKVHERPSALLNLCGRFLFALVIFDATENALTLGLIALTGWWYPVLDCIARGLLFVASNAKFAALAATVLFAATGVFVRLWLWARRK